MGLVQLARTLGLTAFIAASVWSGSAAASDVLRASQTMLDRALLITVTGTASKQVPPDQLTMQVSVSGFGPDVGSVVEDLNAQKKELMEAAEAEDVELIGTDVTSLNVRNKHGHRRNKPKSDTDFHGRMQVSLTMRFTGDPLALIAKISDGRVDGIASTRFQVSDTSVDSEALRAEALADARERAAKKAEVLETKLGRLVNVSYRETPFRGLRGSSGKAVTVRAIATFAREDPQ